MTNLLSESLHRHMPEPVVALGYNLSSLVQLFKKLEAAYGFTHGKEATFAHVLNVPISEEIGPGDAIELFSLPFFAKSPYTGEFDQQGKVFEHMRCETLRLCSGKYSAKEFMEDELAFYYEFEGSFTDGFGDSSDDEGELLLTIELDW